MIQFYIYMYIFVIHIYVYIYIYIFFFRFFSLIGYYKILTIVPCALIDFLKVIFDYTQIFLKLILSPQKKTASQ